MAESSFGLIPDATDVFLRHDVSRVVSSKVPVVGGLDDETVVINHHLEVVPFIIRMERVADPVPVLVALRLQKVVGGRDEGTRSLADVDGVDGRRPRKFSRTRRKKIMKVEHLVHFGPSDGGHLDLQTRRPELPRNSRGLLRDRRVVSPGSKVVSIKARLCVSQAHFRFFCSLTHHERIAAVRGKKLVLWWQSVPVLTLGEHIVAIVETVSERWTWRRSTMMHHDNDQEHKQHKIKKKKKRKEKKFSFTITNTTNKNRKQRDVRESKKRPGRFSRQRSRQTP